MNVPEAPEPKPVSFQYPPFKKSQREICFESWRLQTACDVHRPLVSDGGVTVIAGNSFSKRAAAAE